MHKTVFALIAIFAAMPAAASDFERVQDRDHSPSMPKSVHRKPGTDGHTKASGNHNGGHRHLERPQRDLQQIGVKPDDQPECGRKTFPDVRHRATEPICLSVPSSLDQSSSVPFPEITP